RLSAAKTAQAVFAAESRAADFAHHLARHARGVQLLDIHAREHLLGGVTEDARRSVVVQQHAPLQIRRDDRVDGTVDHSLEELFGLKQLALGLPFLCHVAKGDQDRPRVAERRAEVDADYALAAGGAYAEVLSLGVDARAKPAFEGTGALSFFRG